jgi:hypothetical protein
MKRYLILLLLVSFCGSSSETTSVEDNTITSSSTTSTSTSTTSSSTTTSTTTTTSPVTVIEVEPSISISCAPSVTEDGQYLSFTIKVTKGSSDLEVVNIVSWFDSTRTDDLFISESLPEDEGSSRELSYKVDSSFSKYEIEVLVMDESEKFGNDYCLWNKPIEMDYFDVGLIAPVTGDLAFIGPYLKSASEFAVYEINQILKSKNIELRLFFEDSGSDGERTIEAFTNLMEKNIKYIIGPSTTRPYLKLLNSQIYNNNSDVLIISPTAGDGLLDDVIKNSNSYKFCNVLNPPCSLGDGASVLFINSYTNFMNEKNESPTNAISNEARFYDATYLVSIAALDNYLFGNNSDRKLENYVNNSYKCNPADCISNILANNQIDYVGASGDLKITNNVLDK